MLNRVDAMLPRGVHRVLGSMRRDGLTLVEVLAALVILGGSVTAMLVAQSTSMEHLQTCQRQLTARNVAKELIATWRLKGENLEIAASGDVDGLGGWSWRRTAQQRQIAEGVTVVEVTLEVIYSPPGEREAPWVRPYRWLVKNEKKTSTA